jgi:hypothetical protein
LKLLAGILRQGWAAAAQIRADLRCDNGRQRLDEIVDQRACGKLADESECIVPARRGQRLGVAVELRHGDCRPHAAGG